MTDAPTPWTGWSDAPDSVLAGHDAVLLDLDGVVYVGEHAVDGAVDTIADVRHRGLGIAFVTNNAARTPDVVADHLRDLGVDATAADVVTSSQAAAALLRDRLGPGSRVLCVGAEGLTTAVAEVGLRPVTSADDEPQAVVQGFSPRLDWQMLLEACVAIRSGVPWIATNLDRTLPTPRGTAPGNGAFVDVVRQTTGAEPAVAGKPYRPLMDASVARIGASRALVVGDRLDTDLAGARRAGLDGALVLTGVTDVPRLLAADPGERPDYLTADLPGLLTPHPAPRPDGDGSWIDGTLRVTTDDGGAPVLDGAGPGGDADAALAVLRLVTTALWCGPAAGRVATPDVVRLALDALRPWLAGTPWEVP